MRDAAKCLARNFRENAAELTRRLGAPQAFPHLDDGPEARKLLAEIAAADAEGDESEGVWVNHRLRNMRRLQKVRYEEWLQTNAKIAAAAQD